MALYTPLAPLAALLGSTKNAALFPDRLPTKPTVYKRTEVSEELLELH